MKKSSILLLAVVAACAKTDNRGAEGSDDGSLPTAGDSAEEGSGLDSGPDDSGSGGDSMGTGGDDGALLDTIPDESDSGGCMESDQCGTCEAPEHTACDGNGDIANAIGLNCPGEPQVTVTTMGNPDAIAVRGGFGPSAEWDPVDGSQFVVIGSGFASDLDQMADACDPMNFGECCSRDLDGPDVLDIYGPYDPGTTLPPPIVTNDVGAVTCADDEGLIGTGDCSNTLQAEFADTAEGAFDYTEIRVEATVPQGVTSFSYDFTFFSYEWPDFWKSQYNDIYIGWLESERWTGNISFDEAGNAISVNAGFFDFLDSDTFNTDNGMPHPVCPEGAGCSAPELQGTCMQGHGGTKWLTTTAPVEPGEDVTIVFAAMDLGDSILDSYAFIDNFQWGCDPDQPPTTVPID